MMETKPVCKNFEQHPQRKLCAECKHPKEGHTLDKDCVQHIQEEVESLAKDSGAEEPRSDNTYSWIPPGCPKERVEEYFKHFPDEKVPKRKSDGETFCLKQIMRQVPLTDVSEEHCRFVGPDFKADLEAHIDNIRNNALHFGSVKAWKGETPMQCLTCQKPLESDVLVVVPTEETSSAYHPNCFICCVCSDQLIDLLHCVDISGSIYCVRHYSETRKKRCQTCDELIFTAKFAQVGDYFYHMSHLLCCYCDEFVKDSINKDGELYCAKCYEEKFSHDCEKCGKSIAMDSDHVTFEDKFWHYDCFSCDNCGQIISTFEKHEGKLYCTTCYNENFTARPNEYTQEFKGTTRKVKYEANKCVHARPSQNVIYHVNCFKCRDCGDLIGTGTCVKDGSQVYCKGCHAKSFGVRCIRCGYAITDHRCVMFDKQPFHRECFTCGRCQKDIADDPFKQKEGKLYCVNCYRELFNEKCHICDRPISIGEDAILYSYGDYKWHSGCFVCCMCKRPLTKSPFTVCGKNLVCKNCTSQGICRESHQGSGEQGIGRDRCQA